MILKIRGTSRWGRWKIIDNIENVDVNDRQKFNLKSAKDWDEFRKAHSIIALPILPEEEEKKDEYWKKYNGIYYRSLWCRDRNGNYLSICFTTFVFVMNDQGKTIERITVVGE